MSAWPVEMGVPPAKLYEKPEPPYPLAHARGSDPSPDRKGGVAFNRFFDLVFPRTAAATGREACPTSPEAP
jgi:hypothetical protein